MYSLDCTDCPQPPGACGDCLVDALSSANHQVIDGEIQSCGYWVAEDVKGAIAVLRQAGLVTKLEIVGGSAVA